MVKRQTVWLSTMMVLSLMLIGYYTLGTPASPSTQDVNASGSTSVVPTNANSLGATKTVAKTSTSTAPASKPTSSLANDWFAQTSLDQMQSESKVIQTLQNEISDPHVSQAAASSAYSQLTAIQTQQAEANKIHDLLTSSYPDSLVIFNPQGEVHVWVEASSLSPTSAVKVIDLVSQTLGIQSNQVIVSAHV
ncbi:MAG: SpoIIIAH-like family protein [Acidibacillus sp.]|uniref:Stage III sporulation protein AH n=1 Tax=Sulfoacidibacillus ferrooxidans TaxID=2005001 RepID=A0A9X1VAF2_9BACL|nr:SpoIIIAH-like family protein [Sulfoacidibacillus ferrooxidans]MCI0183148.1 Stage III sporulation protein AH [Sulfoacidibacillus ferrooxidans]MCY0893143.1 SpoIIIAH-like family protein [Acidibacillus sp.]